MAGPVATAGASARAGTTAASGAGSDRPRPTDRRIDSMNVMTVFYASIVQKPLRNVRERRLRDESSTRLRTTLTRPVLCAHVQPCPRIGRNQTEALAGRTAS